MDLDELRDALEEIGSRTAVDPTAARAAVGVRGRRLQRRRRSVALVSIAAVTALVVGAIALANSHDRRSVDVNPVGPAPVSTVVPTTVPTSPKTTPSSTAALANGDPLPVGAVMLEVSDRTISLLDANGNSVGTLFTPPVGGVVTNAQLTPDHRTLYYAIHPAPTLTSCPAIMRVDLQTKIRTIAGTADDFALTPDGSKLVLVFPRSDPVAANNCQPVPLPPGVSTYEAALLERDLKSGAQWILPVGGDHLSPGTGGPYGHVFVNAEGNTLLTTNCVEEGCFANGYSVPVFGTGTIDYRAAGPTCGCPTFVAGTDGVYGVDIGGTQSTQMSVRRYSWDQLQGSGTVIATSNDFALASVAPTPAGVFVIGHPRWQKRAVFASIYRVENGTLRPVASTSADQVFAIPPFDGP